MAKIIYRLDLTLKELDEIRNKFDADLINKFKEIEITEKKIDSMKRASSKKSELTRIRFVNGLLDLQKKEIEPTQYNLRKYKKISYPTSKKYFELLEIAKKNITEILSIEEHYVLDETIEHEDDKRCIYELEKFLLEQMKNKS